MVSFVTVVVSLVVGFFAYVLHLNRHQIRYVVDTSTIDIFESAMRDDGVTADCEGVIFDEIRTIRNVHDFATANKIQMTYDAPVLIKGFLKNPVQMWDDIYEKQKDTPLEYASMKLNGFGNSFIRGSTMAGQVKSTLEKLIHKADDGFSYFAAFLPFMTPESTNLVLPGVDFSQFMFDQSFISNFEEDTVSTSFHAAAGATSYAVQLTGSKLWVFSDPIDFEKYNVMHMPAGIPVNSTEKEFFESGKPVAYILQEAGDMLIFPPHWAHAVITKKGPNFMLNFRKLDFIRAFKIHFWGNIQTIIATVLFRVFQTKHDLIGKKLKEGYTLTSPTNNNIEKQFAQGGATSNKQDSGCKDYFISLLHRND